MAWKQTFRSSYVHHRNRLLKGYQEVAILIGVLNNLMIIWIFLKTVFGISNKYIWLMPLVAAVVLFAMYSFGWFWDRKGFFKEDLKWHSNRNPVMMEVYEIIKKANGKTDKPETP